MLRSANWTGCGRCMNVKVLLLADDLTGACDAAVHFAMRGLRTIAAVSLECTDRSVPVWAVNTDSRDCGCAEIERLMERAGATLPVGPETVIFKKIDSTLRGNAGMETLAAMKAFQCEAAVFTPALPALDRTVENGVLRVRGRPEFQPIEVEAWLRGQKIESSAGFLLPDAACDADLDRIVAQGLALGRRVLWAGSAGLAAALARTMGTSPSGSRRLRGGPPVFAIGSTHMATAEQLECLRRHGSHRVVPIPRGEALGGDVLVLLAGAPALVLSGGDTAAAVCRALGAQRIELVDEIIPGVPWGVLRGGAQDGIPVATKSGGFGAPDALIRIANFFRCPQT
jgi:uncharacterized protein YgbK (DUF1537 family)